tara:strand:+ start:153 stop:362 length:210 start_codon:yes stop_codon:yes gene_type:complete
MACAPCIAAAASGPLAPMALAATGTYMLVKGKPCKKKKIIIKKTCKKKRKRKSRRKRKSKRKNKNKNKS